MNRLKFFKKNCSKNPIKVKADNDKLLERNALLENQLSDILMRFNESSARRKIEEQTFRRILKNEKLSFDKKLAQKVMKLKERLV